MKVGIITFHASHNCGSMLQAFALTTVLKQMNIPCEIIDFANEGSRAMYNSIPPIHPFKRGVRGRFSKWWKTLPYVSLLDKQKEFYIDFMTRFLPLTKTEYKSNADLQKAHFDYTHYICGSDQVWNISCGDADDSYFLNFVKGGAHKIAYACSLGANVIKDKAKDVNVYKNYLSTFDALSVREKNAVKQIEDLSGKHVELLVDPTLLLNQFDYEKLLNVGERLIKEDYIFYYAFNYTTEVNDTVMEISKRYGLPVYIIDARAWGPQGKRKEGLRLFDKSGPVVFLNLMKYAKLSLTTSFHGTVFSVIFGKPFWFINSSMHNSMDDRASSLLEMLGLSDHLIYGNDLLCNRDVFETIDYASCYERIEQEKKKAIDYLKNNLK